MSFARIALRLAVIDALNADPVVAALCEGRVYDSRIDELDAKDPVPLIVVYTEDDGGKAWSANNGGAPFKHECDLQLEIAMRGTVPGDDGDVSLTLMQTDREIEALLDVLEEVAVKAITVGDTPQSTLVRTVTRRFTELRSSRFASAESGGKLALRVVSLTAELKDFQPDLLNPPTDAFAALPDPLRLVALAQTPGSSGLAVCQAIVAKLTLPTATPFAGADLTIQAAVDFDPANPPSETSQTAADPILEKIDLS